MKTKSNGASQPNTGRPKRKPSTKKQTEDALREYQSILAAAEEVAKIGSWKWDLRTQKVSWSDEMFRLFGVEREGFDGNVNRVVAERIHPQDAAAVAESNRRVLEEANPIPMSYRIVLPNGTERTVWAQGQLIRDEAGQPQALTGFVQDITERVSAEKKIIQMKRLYAALSQVNQMIVRVKERDELFQTICDVAVQFGEFDLAWVGLLDEASGEVRPVAAYGGDIKQWQFPIVNLHDESHKNTLTATAFRTSQVVSSKDMQVDTRLELLRRTIPQMSYHAMAVIPFQLRGKTIGVFLLLSHELGLFEQMDEIKLLNEMGLDISFALDNMENERIRRQWSDAFEHCAHGIAIGLPNSQILTCNPAFARGYGASIEEISGMPISSIYAADDREAVRQFIAQADQTGSAQYQAHMIRKDGSTFPVQMDVVSVRDETGNLLYRVATQQDISERMRADEALRESEERLRLSLMASSQGLYDLNVQTGNTIVNRQYAEMLGYDFETFIETNAFWIERLHPDDQEITAKAYRDYISGLLPEYRVEFRQRTKDGNWKWILSLGKVIEHDAQGNPLRMLGTHTDITERKKAEQVLRESESRFSKIFQASPTGINMFSIANGRSVDVNETFLEIVGYSREEVFQHTAAELNLFVDIEARNRWMKKLGLGESVYNQDAKVRRKNGEVRDVLVSLDLIELNGEKMVLVIAADITERKKAEEALQHSEYVLRLFVEHSPASIAMFDQDMKYIVASHRYLIDYGLPLQDVVGRSHYDIFPEIPERWKEIHRRCLNGAIEKAEEDPFPRTDGKMDWVRWEIRPWYEETNKIGGVILFSEVITERKQAQDELRFLNMKLEQRVNERTAELQHANRAKDEFLANMSHELRTPLNTVLGLSETLLEQQQGTLSKKQMQSVELIASSGQHLLGLINDILEVSKIEAGKLELHPGKVLVKELCESSLNFVKEMAAKKSLSVEFRDETSISTLQADPQRLKQILINLLTNAAKFTPERGRIRLSVTTNTEQDQILFSVEDTGIGISPEDLKKIFVPFTQLDSSLSCQSTGTGLGLALVQKLTDLHGGSVQIESEVGKGSRFTVVLPLHQSIEEETSTSEMKLVDAGLAAVNLTSVSTERCVVLLAEDNQVNAEMMSEYLTAHGCHVILAQDGEDVLEKAAEIVPDIILMDIQMPKMDGLEAMRHLRADSRFAFTPVIALTALAMPGDKERCLEAGANEYLSKPVSLRMLFNLIERLTKPGR